MEKSIKTVQMIAPKAIAILGLAALAGCATPPPEQANPQMGEELIDPQEAGRIFANVCADTLPDFVEAPRAMGRYPLVRDTTTGRYVNSDFQFQMGLQDGQCFMVFSAIDAVNQVVLAVDAGLVEEGYTSLAFTFDVTETATPGISGYAFVMNSQ